MCGAIFINTLAHIAHKSPAAKHHSAAITGCLAETAICSVSTRLHRDFGKAPNTDGALTLLATKICERCGLIMFRFLHQNHKSAANDPTM